MKYLTLCLRCNGKMSKFLKLDIQVTHSHLSNKRGGRNKRRGGANYAKSLNLEVGKNMEGGILWKKLMHNCNERGVEGGKNLRNQ